MGEGMLNKVYAHFIIIYFRRPKVRNIGIRVYTGFLKIENYFLLPKDYEASVYRPQPFLSLALDCI
jgi:hypothetical protein